MIAVPPPKIWINDQPIAFSNNRERFRRNQMPIEVMAAALAWSRRAFGHGRDGSLKTARWTAYDGRC
jgi:hypothetical protein